MNIAALIIGIGGWEKYTRPLNESLRQHEPGVHRFIIDNESPNVYPTLPEVHRTERLCYSAAINRAHAIAGAKTWWGPPKGGYDWYVVLSNDVLCQGPFVPMLEALPFDCIAGPCLKETRGYSYLEGWCVCIPAPVWDALGGWDEAYRVSSWEDVDLSQTAIERGYDVVHCPDLPFTHLDQRQRFTLVNNYWDSERHNVEYFMSKRKAAA